MQLSRRQLFRLDFGRSQEAPAAPARPALLPPGALERERFLSACTRCEDCIDACPHDALSHAGSDVEPELGGYPVVLTDATPCWLCSDLPCVAACAEGALDPRTTVDDVRMGTLGLRAAACFSVRGGMCDVCVERCPVRPKPISVAFGELPRLDPERCAGCGVCAWLCPADALVVG